MRCSQIDSSIIDLENEIYWQRESLIFHIFIKPVLSLGPDRRDDPPADPLTHEHETQSWRRQVQTSVWYFEWEALIQSVIALMWILRCTWYKEHGIRLRDTRPPGFKWVTDSHWRLLSMLWGRSWLWFQAASSSEEDNIHPQPQWRCVQPREVPQADNLDLGHAGLQVRLQSHRRRRGKSWHGSYNTLTDLLVPWYFSEKIHYYRFSFCLWL